MSNFTERERGFEAKYSFDLEQDFRVEAHLYKKLAAWAAQEMGMDPAASEEYATKVVGNIVVNPRENGVIAVLLADFGRKNIDMTASQLNRKMEELRPIARAELHHE